MDRFSRVWSGWFVTCVIGGIAAAVAGQPGPGGDWDLVGIILSVSGLIAIAVGLMGIGAEFHAWWLERSQDSAELLGTLAIEAYGAAITGPPALGRIDAVPFVRFANAGTRSIRYTMEAFSAVFDGTAKDHQTHAAMTGVIAPNGVAMYSSDPFPGIPVPTTASVVIDYTLIFHRLGTVRPVIRLSRRIRFTVRFDATGAQNVTSFVDERPAVEEATSSRQRA